MGAKFVSTEKVKAARVSLKRFERHKPPAIRTEHYAAFLQHFAEIKELLNRGAQWVEIQQRYFRKADAPPSVRSLQRYYLAAVEERKKTKRRGA